MVSSVGWLGLLFLVQSISVSNGFWMLSSMEIASLGAMDGRCGLLPGLSRSQRIICLRHPDAMDTVIEGLAMSIEACEAQFRDQKWNCSNALHGNAGFGLAPLKVASRESAFVFAISSAGVAHALARSCASGAVADCGCATYSPPNLPVKKDFYWTGCSDNIRYGNQFSRQFFDVNENQRGDARAQMNKHNNAVGRKLMANSMRRQCKCHGVSGSCMSQTCWKVVPKFDRYAALLRRKYEEAVMVTVGRDRLLSLMANGGRDRLLSLSSTPGGGNGTRSQRYLINPSTQIPPKTDLVYLDPSPDYCNPNRERGIRGINTNIINNIINIRGTRGRECPDREKCSLLCCNRGWDTFRQLVEEPCQCKFIWCCNVKCQTCIKAVDRHFCR